MKHLTGRRGVALYFEEESFRSSGSKRRRRSFELFCLEGRKEGAFPQIVWDRDDFEREPVAGLPMLTRDVVLSAPSHASLASVDAG